jgi:hypothetical protein
MNVQSGWRVLIAKNEKKIKKNKNLDLYVWF